MATFRVNAIVLRCDGCRAEFDSGRMFSSAMEARSAGFAAGWRFPPRLTTAGESSRTHTSDVCDGCLTDWQPVPIRTRSGYMRLDGSTRDSRGATEPPMCGHVRMAEEIRDEADKLLTDDRTEIDESRVDGIYQAAAMVEVCDGDPACGMVDA